MLQARNPNAQKSACIAFLLALAPDGVYQATLLPMHWCALTAPFQLFALYVVTKCGTYTARVFFSVALIRQITLPSC